MTATGQSDGRHGAVCRGRQQSPADQARPIRRCRSSSNTWTWWFGAGVCISDTGSPRPPSAICTT